VYIDYYSEWLEDDNHEYHFIGITCDQTGKPRQPMVGRFDESGDWSIKNPKELTYSLEEIFERETINIYGKTYYKDEYEKVEEAFQKALAGLNEVKQS